MVKRAFDILSSGIGLFILFPLILLIGVSIKLLSPGPVFYRAKRVGRYGKPFYLYKFRTMVISADTIGTKITHAQDTRVTSIGRFLRRYKLDELPQLINVFVGDMSVVGPRPEDPYYVALYTLEQQKVLQVRPGITSPASLHYHNEESMLIGDNWEEIYVSEIMPMKLSMDIEYLSQRGLWQDIKLILETIGRILRKFGTG